MSRALTEKEVRFFEELSELLHEYRVYITATDQATMSSCRIGFQFIPESLEVFHLETDRNHFGPKDSIDFIEMRKVEGKE